MSRSSNPGDPPQPQVRKAMARLARRDALTREAAPAGAQAPDGNLVIGQRAGPYALDGGLNAVGVDRNLSSARYDTVFSSEWEGESGSIVPNVAIEHVAVDDTTWWLAPRQDTQRLDGSPFAASDLKLTIERPVDDPATDSAQPACYARIEPTDIVDDHTVHTEARRGSEAPGHEPSLPPPGAISARRMRCTSTCYAGC